MAEIFASLRDPLLSATLVSRTPLNYADGPVPALDRPAHARAGSSLAWLGSRIAVAQDDANFVALFHPADGRLEALTLPPGAGGLRQFDDGRGNKEFKLDLEASFSAPLEQGETLVILGSGASRFRETVILIDAAGKVETFLAERLYARLRSAVEFSGSEMNLEGAVYLDGRVRFFNRGNGAPRNGLMPVNATCDMAWDAFQASLRNPHRAPDPEFRRIRRYDLGDILGSPLTFTDASTTPLGLLYTASAEDSPDALTDGTVLGSAIGVMDETGHGRWVELRTAQGEPFAEKIEGICPSRKDDRLVYVVVDADDPARPSELCEIRLEGPWRHRVTPACEENTHE